MAMSKGAISRARVPPVRATIRSTSAAATAVVKPASAKSEPKPPICDDYQAIEDKKCHLHLCDDCRKEAVAADERAARKAACGTCQTEARRQAEKARCERCKTKADKASCRGCGDAAARKTKVSDSICPTCQAAAHEKTQPDSCPVCHDGSDKQSKGKNNMSNNSHEGDNGGNFAKNEDDTVRKIKSESKPQVEIQKAMSKSQDAPEVRWRELGGGDGDGNEQQKGDNGQKNGSKDGETRADVDSTKVDDPKARSNVIKGGNKSGGSTGSKDRRDCKAEPLRFTLAEWRMLTEDEHFTFRDLEHLNEIVADDFNERWERIASRYFDATGHRVASQQIHDKFRGMGWAGGGDLGRGY